ncbi:MAG: response regulator [Candidatus Omnitrophica bacterium]|nr:response regulator [Candidatus Omnitrophota bacterium]
MAEDRIKLLIVDDEPDVCTAVQSYFGRRNFMVSTTGSGIEALSMIKASGPDVVLLDMMLDDLNGFEVLTQLRAYDKKTRVIVITGQEFTSQEVERIVGLGVDCYGQKPLVLAEVERLVCNSTQTKPFGASDKFLKNPLEPAQGTVKHKLVNALGIIRGKCEVFNLNLKDGFYKDKSPQDLVEISSGIMQDIQDIVDKTCQQAKGG